MKARVLRTNKIVEVECLGKLGKFSKIFRDIQSGIEYTEKDIVFCFDLNSSVCTDCHQSVRLLALGLRKETADMAWLRGHEKPVVLSCPFNDKEGRCTPAWSLHRLIEMMPLDVIPEGGFDNCFTLIKNYPKGYSVEYDGFSYYNKENIYDTLIDGMEHLIKEGYFNKEYLV